MKPPQKLTAGIGALMLTLTIVGLLAVPPMTRAAPEGYTYSEVELSPQQEAQLRETTIAGAPGTRSGSGTTAPNVPCDWSDVGCWILKAVNYITDWLFFIPFSLAESFFSVMLHFNLNPFSPGGFLGLVTQNGFPVVLGVANMFFVLILLWIAIATIFDFEPYTARSLLVNLIMAALLINFSMPIGRAIIGLSNGIGQIFYNNLIETGGGSVQGAVQRIFNVEAIQKAFLESPLNVCRGLSAGECTNRIYSDVSGQTSRGQMTAKECEGRAVTAHGGAGSDTEESNPTGCDQIRTKAAFEARKALGDQAYSLQALMIVVKLIVYPIAIFVLFAAAIMLTMRMISLAFILILGPMAFLFLILPATRNLWTMWWDRLFKWSFFLPAFLFFFWLTFAVVKGIPEEFFIAQVGSQKVLNEYSAMVAYLFGAAFMIGSLMVANYLGIHGASTVTGWGKKMSGAAGKWAKGRGWKYAGRATEAAMRVPGLRQVIGRVPPLRAAATATMTKGVGVEKKDIDFYTKLQDRQLAVVLSTMSGARARAIWGALPARRQRDAKPELAQLARNRGWTNAPSLPQTPAQTQQAQNQAIQNQVVPVLQGLTQFQQLPQNLQTAITQGVQQAIQQLPQGATPQATTQVIQRAVQQVAQAQPPAAAIVIQPAINAIRTQTSQVQAAVEAAIQGTAATQRGQRPNVTEQDLRDRLDEYEERLGEVEGRK